MMDARSAQTLHTLLAPVQSRFRAFYEAANAAVASQGLTVRFLSGTRSYAEQAALYAQGRTAPGKIVTQAKPGYSNHNFGIAVDCGIFKKNAYLSESPAYDALGPVGEKCGLLWGGRWKKPKTDRPHFEAKTAYTLAQMRERVAASLPIV